MFCQNALSVLENNSNNFTLTIKKKKRVKILTFVSDQYNLLDSSRFSHSNYWSLTVETYDKNGIFLEEKYLPRVGLNQQPLDQSVYALTNGLSQLTHGLLKIYKDIHCNYRLNISDDEQSVMVRASRCELIIFFSFNNAGVILLFRSNIYLWCNHVLSLYRQHI